MHLETGYTQYQVDWPYADIKREGLQNGPCYVIVRFRHSGQVITKKALIGVFL